jgi:hypothetical protein
MEPIGFVLTREDFGELAWKLPEDLQAKLWSFRNRMIDAKGKEAGAKAAQDVLELAERALTDTICAIIAGLDQVGEQGVAVSLNTTVKRNDQTYSLAVTAACPARNVA